MSGKTKKGKGGGKRERKNLPNALLSTGASDWQKHGIMIERAGHPGQINQPLLTT